MSELREHTTPVLDRRPAETIDWTAYWHSVHVAVRAVRPELDDPGQFLRSRSRMSSRGLAALWQLRGQHGHTISPQFVPAQDVGMGVELQHALNESLGANRVGADLAVLGGLYNAMVGLFDRFVDDYPELFEPFADELSGPALVELLQGCRSTALPDDDSLPFPVRLLRNTADCATVYGVLARRIAAREGTEGRWNQFLDDFVRIAQRQNQTLELGEVLDAAWTLPTGDAAARVDELCAVAEQRTSWTYFPFAVHSCLDGGAREIGVRHREAIDLIGKIFVLLDDLVDLPSDVASGTWTTITLGAARSELTTRASAPTIAEAAALAVDPDAVATTVARTFATYEDGVQRLSELGAPVGLLRRTLDTVLLGLAAAARAGAQGDQSWVR